MKPSCDVAILGGGPAGLAAAAALASRGASVVVFERGRLGAPKVGETLGPEIMPLLRALGAEEAVAPEAALPFRGVRSAWGSAEIVERPSILNALGEGRHVDRARFDGALARIAARAGATLREETGAVDVITTSSGLLVRSAGDAETHCRFLLDASGRGAPGGAAGIPGRRWLACDRTVAIVAKMAFSAGRELHPELLIESAQDGWWYAAPLPDATLLVVMLTDADLVAAGPRSALSARFMAALGRTTHASALTEGATLAEAPRIVRAEPGRLLPDRGPRWRAVGDAAAAGDPLSGDGVARAVRSALDAANELAPALAEGREAELNDASGETAAWLEGYLDRRARYYAMETRWPGALFWARRHAGDWRSSPIVLDPRSTLSWDGTDPEPSALAPAEALIPPRAVRAALELLRRPRRAHEALSALVAAAPLGDRRLLVGLQRLTASGVVTVTA